MARDERCSGDEVNPRQVKRERERERGEKKEDAPIEKPRPDRSGLPLELHFSGLAGAFARARLIIARAKKAMVAATVGFMARGAPGRV